MGGETSKQGGAKESSKAATPAAATPAAATPAAPAAAASAPVAAPAKAKPFIPSTFSEYYDNFFKEAPITTLYTKFPQAAKPKSAPKAEAKKGAKKEKGEAKGKGKGKEGKEGKGKGKGEVPNSKICVKNLAPDTTTEKLKALFASHGTITYADAKLKEDGKCRGFGFVTFSTAEEAEKAMAAMNGTQHGDKTLQVVPAERRENKTEDGKGKGKKGEKGKGKGMTPEQYQQYYQQMYMQQYAQYQQYAMAAMAQQQQGGRGQQAYNPYYSAAQAAMMQQYQGAAQGAYSGAQAAGGAKTGEYEGSVKSISAQKGYGFIACSMTHELYQRDVFLSEEIMPEGCKVGSRVIFTLGFNEKKHPKAENVKLAGLQPTSPQSSGAVR